MGIRCLRPVDGGWEGHLGHLYVSGSPPSNSLFFSKSSTKTCSENLQPRYKFNYFSGRSPRLAFVRGSKAGRIDRIPIGAGKVHGLRALHYGTINFCPAEIGMREDCLGNEGVEL